MMRHVTLYTRPGCHLCDDVRQDLWLLEAEWDISVKVVNIETDPTAFQRFQFLIPVVDVEDGPLLTPPITLADLRQALS